jgi:hypothetical protein
MSQGLCDDWWADLGVPDDEDGERYRRQQIGILIHVEIKAADLPLGYRLRVRDLDDIPAVIFRGANAVARAKIAKAGAMR